MEPGTGPHENLAGVQDCYAETFAERFRGVPGHPFEQGFELRLVPDALELPKLPATWTPCPRETACPTSFHERIPDGGYIRQVFEVMGESPPHCFQVLTKRAERLEELSPKLLFSPNVWVGVSVENDDYAWRVDHLRRVPAAVRFLSIEPMLGPMTKLNLDKIHWVIVGGESGHGARPMDPSWVRGVRDDRRRGCVPFFFKPCRGVITARGSNARRRTWDEMPTAPVSLLDLKPNA